jgi:LemA protein
LDQAQSEFGLLHFGQGQVQQIQGAWDIFFQQLQSQLSEIEGQLQFARQYYNDSVVALNTAVRTIPSMWFTGLAKVTVREMYNEPDEGRRSAPQVQF